MIDIPLNKALVAVEISNTARHRCDGCYFYTEEGFSCKLSCYDNNPPAFVRFVACSADHYREDGKNVIFKLIDWPREEEK